MSEEQSGFKVTDRRLFNPDGSPREGITQEREKSSTSENVASGVAAPAPVRHEQPQPTAASEKVASEPDTFADDEVADENDPASFVNFLMSIASNAASSLGMMEHPVTGQRGVDLEVGKHWVDVLGMLQTKTRNNLTREEHQILEGLLADLRMQYVSLTSGSQNRAAGGAGGFSGKDILGGD